MQSSIEVTHLRQKVDFLNEVSHILFWRKNDKEMHYLYFARYSNEKPFLDTKGDEWEGRVKLLANQIQEVKVGNKENFK